jgi:hypothetical protein
MLKKTKTIELIGKTFDELDEETQNKILYDNFEWELEATIEMIIDNFISLMKEKYNCDIDDDKIYYDIYRDCYVEIPSQPICWIIEDKLSKILSDKVWEKVSEVRCDSEHLHFSRRSSPEFGEDVYVNVVEGCPHDQEEYINSRASAIFYEIREDLEAFYNEMMHADDYARESSQEQAKEYIYYFNENGELVETDLVSTIEVSISK